MRLLWLGHALTHQSPVPSPGTLLGSVEQPAEPWREEGVFSSCHFPHGDFMDPILQLDGRTLWAPGLIEEAFVEVALPGERFGIAFSVEGLGEWAAVGLDEPASPWDELRLADFESNEDFVASSMDANSTNVVVQQSVAVLAHCRWKVNFYPAETSVVIFEFVRFGVHGAIKFVELC